MVTKASTLSVALLGITTISFLILSNSTASAETTSDISITVPVSCNITTTLDTTHTANIYNGTFAEDIGTTTFKTFCNDNTGYSIYAIGYSGEEYGNTNLLPTNTSNPAITTGLATSGNISNWAMKLTPVTEQSSGSSQPYVPTIESDTNGSFANYHIVPEEYTKVATFTSTTDFTIGSSLTSTYRVFIQGKQPADTYAGKVKYTLVHPNDANPPEKPITPQETAELVPQLCGYITQNGGCGEVDDHGIILDTYIKAIKMADSIPEGFVEGTDYYNVASENSYNPIYKWFDNTNDAGIVYFYTEAKKIYMNEDSSYMFTAFSTLTDISGVANWDTSRVTNLSIAFMGASSLTNIDALSNWNTSSVTDMSGIFSDASSLTDISALSNWDTSNVTTMGGMFSGATPLINIDGVSNWNTSSVTDMSGIFSGASSLTNIDGASNWDTSNVTNMSYMFSRASSLTNIDALSDWDTSSVTNMSSMFSRASSLTNIDALSDWDTSSVTDMGSMFSGASSLTDISGAANWNTSNVTNIESMFSGANNIDATVLNNWDVSKVTRKYNAFTCPADKRPSWY